MAEPTRAKDGGEISVVLELDEAADEDSLRRKLVARHGIDPATPFRVLRRSIDALNRAIT